MRRVSPSHEPSILLACSAARAAGSSRSVSGAKARDGLPADRQLRRRRREDLGEFVGSGHGLQVDVAADPAHDAIGFFRQVRQGQSPFSGWLARSSLSSGIGPSISNDTR